MIGRVLGVKGLGYNEWILCSEGDWHGYGESGSWEYISRRIVVAMGV